MDTIGAALLVVHEAFEMIRSFVFNKLSLTPLILLDETQLIKKLLPKFKFPASQQQLINLQVSSSLQNI